ncbi:MAG: winged helix-turn-helix domain-containing protein, partial [Acidobacteria bacterium]|nr:winged helix-turn-helix domain-containing protein [Acidobacteriota bacterium]MCA1639632.1 winged helix-turn-helix domain-containing protein [Acidobacteriota bacterium]
MALETKYFYDFKNFRLDPEEKVLLHDDKPLAVAPKVLDLLKVLIENHGKLLEKDKLMTEVWADSFVEEGNLTFTVRQLRKILGDDAHEPTFIETVPRRGYRFIAEVGQTLKDERSKDGAAQTLSHPVKKNPVYTPRLKRIGLPIAAIVFFVLIVTGFWYARSKPGESDAPILSAPFASEKLSTSGRVYHAVISSDGKNVIYLNGNGSGKQSVWLRQLESANNVEIIPSSDDVYGGIALSPDGNFLYFNRRPKSVEGQLDIYRVSIFGGIPQKIVNEAQGWISVSPDGAKISFVRCYYRDDEY